jgi:calcineurin-like phosphoesterase family protein
MKTLLAADLHLGHENAAIYRKRFFDPAHHDEIITENILSQLNKRTTLYLLGDVAITEDSFKYIRRFKATGARVILIPGNHCTERVSMLRLSIEYDEVHASLSKFGCWLTHQPIHPDHLRGRLCIHGHLHESVINDPRYLNVSLEQSDFQPVSLDRVREIFSHRISRGELPREAAQRMKFG